MKTFYFYLKKDRPVESAEVIEGGFSYKGFVFTYLWSLFNKMWLFSLMIFCAQILIGTLCQKMGIGNNYIFGFSLALMLYTGITANQWKEISLMSKGYILKDVFIADNLQSAQLRFFNKYLGN